MDAPHRERGNKVITQTYTMGREEAEKLYKVIQQDAMGTGTTVRLHDVVHQQRGYDHTYISLWHDGVLLFTVNDPQKWNEIVVWVQCMFSTIQQRNYNCLYDEM